MDMVSATIRHAVQIAPGAGLLTNEPCDAVLVTTDGALLTVELEQDSGAPVQVPLAANMWHPMCCRKITAISAGNVFAGWYTSPPPIKG